MLFQSIIKIVKNKDCLLRREKCIFTEGNYTPERCREADTK
ncbi:MAG: hypothetical protein ACLVAU_10935 [Ruminococcus sp.]